MVLLFHVGCKENNSGISKTDNTKSQAGLDSCLSEAIDFYAKGGNEFQRTGCDITTQRTTTTIGTRFYVPVSPDLPTVDAVSISSSKKDNNMSAALIVTVPASWLNDKEKVAQIHEEIKATAGCIEEKPNNNASVNPLNKNNESSASVCDGISTTNQKGKSVQTIYHKTKSPHVNFIKQDL